MSLPHTPVTTGFTVTQSSATSFGSGSSRKRTGPNGATKPLVEKNPAMRAAASRGNDISKETPLMVEKEP